MPGFCHRFLTETCTSVPVSASLFLFHPCLWLQMTCLLIQLSSSALPEFLVPLPHIPYIAGIPLCSDFTNHLELSTRTQWETESIPWIFQFLVWWLRRLACIPIPGVSLNPLGIFQLHLHQPRSVYCPGNWHLAAGS